jgi:hypothetical protein
MGNPNKYHRVKLKGLNSRAKKIIKYYNNDLLLREYDDYGRPLMICPNGKQGIFCVSPDGIWNGWFELDYDIEFEDQQYLDNYMRGIEDAKKQ